METCESEDLLKANPEASFKEDKNGLCKDLCILLEKIDLKDNSSYQSFFKDASRSLKPSIKKKVSARLKKIRKLQKLKKKCGLANCVACGHFSKDDELPRTRRHKPPVVISMKSNIPEIKSKIIKQIPKKVPGKEKKEQNHIIKPCKEKKVKQVIDKPNKKDKEKTNTATTKVKKKKKLDTGENEMELKENSSRNELKISCDDPPCDDDHWIHCHLCSSSYHGDCPVHGSMVHVVDKTDTENSSLTRAKASFPDGIYLKESSIENAGLGVFTNERIPARIRFGPYVGLEHTDDATESNYQWEIIKNKKKSHFVDASDENTSNWMRFINCARIESEQNLVATQYRGKIYYDSYKCIEPGQELLVWYGSHFGWTLGLCSADGDSEQSKEDYNPNDVENRVCDPVVICPRKVTSACNFCSIGGCNQSFDKLKSLKNHWIKVHKLEPYKCKICSVEIRNVTLFQKHINEGHEQLKEAYVCEYCDVAFESKSLLLDHKKSHNQTYHCEKCDRFFKSSFLSEKHQLYTCPGRPRFLYHCSRCNENFKTIVLFRKHGCSVEDSVHQLDNKKQHGVQCQLCLQTFSSGTRYANHLKKKHNIIVPYICFKCGLKFQERQKLRNHLNVHYKESRKVGKSKNSAFFLNNNNASEMFSISEFCLAESAVNDLHADNSCLTTKDSSLFIDNLASDIESSDVELGDMSVQFNLSIGSDEGRTDEASNFASIFSGNKSNGEAKGIDYNTLFNELLRSESTTAESIDENQTEDGAAGMNSLENRTDSSQQYVSDFKAIRGLCSVSNQNTKDSADIHDNATVSTAERVTNDIVGSAVNIEEIQVENSSIERTDLDNVSCDMRSQCDDKLTEKETRSKESHESYDEEANISEPLSFVQMDKPLEIDKINNGIRYSPSLIRGYVNTLSEILMVDKSPLNDGTQVLEQIVENAERKDIHEAEKKKVCINLSQFNLDCDRQDQSSDIRSNLDCDNQDQSGDIRSNLDCDNQDKSGDIRSNLDCGKQDHSSGTQSNLDNQDQSSDIHSNLDCGNQDHSSGTQSNLNNQDQSSDIRSNLDCGKQDHSSGTQSNLHCGHQDQSSDIHSNLHCGHQDHSSGTQSNLNNQDQSSDIRSNLDCGKQDHSSDTQSNLNNQDQSSDIRSNLDCGKQDHSSGTQSNLNNQDQSSDIRSNLHCGHQDHSSGTQSNLNNQDQSSDIRSNLDCGNQDHSSGTQSNLDGDNSPDVVLGFVDEDQSDHIPANPDLVEKDHLNQVTLDQDFANKDFVNQEHLDRFVSDLDCTNRKDVSKINHDNTQGLESNSSNVLSDVDRDNPYKECNPKIRCSSSVDSGFESSCGGGKEQNEMLSEGSNYHEKELFSFQYEKSGRNNLSNESVFEVNENLPVKSHDDVQVNKDDLNDKKSNSVEDFDVDIHQENTRNIQGVKSSSESHISVENEIQFSNNIENDEGFAENMSPFDEKIRNPNIHNACGSSAEFESKSDIQSEENAIASSLSAVITSKGSDIETSPLKTTSSVNQLTTNELVPCSSLDSKSESESQSKENAVASSVDILTANKELDSEINPSQTENSKAVLTIDELISKDMLSKPIDSLQKPLAVNTNSVPTTYDSDNDSLQNPLAACVNTNSVPTTYDSDNDSETTSESETEEDKLIKIAVIEFMKENEETCGKTGVTPVKSKKDRNNINFDPRLKCSPFGRNEIRSVPVFESKSDSKTGFNPRNEFSFKMVSRRLGEVTKTWRCGLLSESKTPNHDVETLSGNNFIRGTDSNNEEKCFDTLFHGLQEIDKTHLFGDQQRNVDSKRDDMTEKNIFNINDIQLELHADKLLGDSIFADCQENINRTYTDVLGLMSSTKDTTLEEKHEISPKKASFHLMKQGNPQMKIDNPKNVVKVIRCENTDESLRVSDQPMKSPFQKYLDEDSQDLYDLNNKMRPNSIRNKFPKSAKENNSLYNGVYDYSNVMNSPKSHNKRTLDFGKPNSADRKVIRKEKRPNHQSRKSTSSSLFTKPFLTFDKIPKKIQKLDKCEGNEKGTKSKSVDNQKKAKVISIPRLPQSKKPISERYSSNVLKLDHEESSGDVPVSPNRPLKRKDASEDVGNQIQKKAKKCTPANDSCLNQNDESTSFESTSNIDQESESSDSSTDDELEKEIEAKKAYYNLLKREITEVKRRIAAKQKRKTQKCKLIKPIGKFNGSKKRKTLTQCYSTPGRINIRINEKFHDLPSKHAKLLKRANFRENTRDRWKIRQGKLKVRLDYLNVVKNNKKGRIYCCNHCQETFLIKPFVISVNRCT